MQVTAGGLLITHKKVVFQETEGRSSHCGNMEQSISTILIAVYVVDKTSMIHGVVSTCIVSDVYHY